MAPSNVHEVHKCGCGRAFLRADSLRRHTLSCRRKVTKRIELSWRNQETCPTCLSLYASVSRMMKDGKHKCHTGKHAENGGAEGVVIKRPKKIREFMRQVVAYLEASRQDPEKSTQPISEEGCLKSSGAKKQRKVKKSDDNNQKKKKDNNNNKLSVSPLFL